MGQDDKVIAEARYEVWDRMVRRQMMPGMKYKTG
jgi:hypothetical protein